MNIFQFYHVIIIVCNMYIVWTGGLIHDFNFNSTVVFVTGILWLLD